MKHKKILTIITVILLTVLLSVTCFAKSKTTTTKAVTTTAPTTTAPTTTAPATTAPVTTNPNGFDINDFGDSYSVDENGQDSFLVALLTKLVNMAMGVFQIISSILTSPDQYRFLNAGGIITTLNRIFLPIGYSVFFICWLIGLARKSTDLELYEGKGMLKEFAILIGGLIFMGISTQLLQLIDRISQSLTNGIVSNSNMNTEAMTQWYANYGDYGSSAPIVGFLIQMIRYTLAHSPQMIFLVILIIVAFLISIILGIRIIKLAIFQGIAPVFFGFIGGESTRRYTQNFIIQYCVLSFQIVLIAVVYSAFQASYMSWLFTGDISITSLTTGLFIMLAYCVIIVKTDKLFDRVFT